MRTLIMKLIDLKKLCAECGLLYQETDCYIYGVFAKQPLMVGSRTNFTGYIYYETKVKVDGNKLVFTAPVSMRNEECNYDEVKETLLKVITEYKEKYAEIRKMNIETDFM